MNSTRFSKRSAFSAVLTAAAITAATVVGISPTFAQQPPDDGKGQAQVVERKGPEVDVKKEAAGRVVVLFPQSGTQQNGQPQQGGEVTITLAESSVPQAPEAKEGEPQQQPGKAMPTGREFVFNSKDARDGVVSHMMKTDASADRKLMVLATIDGKETQVQQTGGNGQDVAIFTVMMPQKPLDQHQQQQPPADPNNPDAQPQKPKEPEKPKTAAIVMIYTGM